MRIGAEIAAVMLFIVLVCMGSVGIKTFTGSLVFVVFSICILFLIVYADRKFFEEKNNEREEQQKSSKKYGKE